MIKLKLTLNHSSCSSRLYILYYLKTEGARAEHGVRSVIHEWRTFGAKSDLDCY